MRVLVTGSAGTIGYQAIRQMASVSMMCGQQICLEKKSEERFDAFVNKPHLRLFMAI